jgi:hypothetical protein
MGILPLPLPPPVIEVTGSAGNIDFEAGLQSERKILQSTVFLLLN